MEVDDRPVLEPERRKISGISPSACLRLEAQGKHPRRYKIGDPDAQNGRVAWSYRELMEWRAERMAARNKPAA
jgi:predicted DNA-binding transcriptional regulator AlpA